MLNGREHDAMKTLNKATKIFHRHVTFKTRLKDALAEFKNGVWLEEEEFRYSLAAHLDFVIVRDLCHVDFEVEYDGPWHMSDQKTIERDHLKNSICDKLGLPLFRVYSNVDTGHDADVLTELVEMYYSKVLSCNARVSVKKMLSKDQLVSDLINKTTGYEISHNDKRELRMETNIDKHGYTQSDLLLTAGDIRIKLGYGRCRVPQGSHVCGKRLSDMLAYRNALRVLAPYKSNNSNLLSHCRKILHTSENNELRASS